MLRLQLLGGCSISCDSAILTGPAVQPRRLALFALLAGSRQTGVSRDKLVAHFWPEEDRDRARHFLADSLFAIRKSFGRDIFLTTVTELRLNSTRISSDLWDFEDSVARGDCAAAFASYGGDFLDGFFVHDAPEFERWVELERDRLRRLCGASIESLALKFEQAGDFRSASDHWLALAARDPYSARVVTRVISALEKSGDPVAAVRYAEKYAHTIRADLEIQPEPEVLQLAERIRTGATRSAGKGIESSFAPVSLAENAIRLEPEVPAIETESPKPQHTRKYLKYAAAFLIVAAASVMVSFATRENAAGGARFDVNAFVRRAAKNVPADSTPRRRAEDLYHRARLISSTGMFPGPLEEPLELYRRAITIDPTFAAAYAGMADLYDTHTQYKLAKESALRALEIDSTLAEGYTALAGPLASSEHRWWAADSALERAVRLKPTYKLAWMRRAYVAVMQGRDDDAMKYLERAAALDPDSWVTLFNTAIIESHAGKLRDALEAFQQAMQLEPSRNDVRTLYARTLWKAGRPSEALLFFRSAGADVEAAIIANDSVEMRNLLRRYKTGTLKVDPARAAMLYAGLRNRDAAFGELNKSASTSLPRWLEEPPLIWMSDDPRYGKLLAKWNILPAPTGH